MGNGEILKKFTAVRVSKKTEIIIEPIIIRDLESVRLVFQPKKVDKIDATIKGDFIYQKKLKNDEWVNVKSIPLSKIKTDECYKLELHSDELKKLYDGLTFLYQIPKDENNQSVRHIVISNKQDLSSSLKSIIDYLTQSPESLKDIDINNLSAINTYQGISILEKAYATWLSNKDNDREEFWQDLVLGNPYLVSYALPFPIVFYKDKALIGGKTINNDGGKIVDFLYHSYHTNNSVLVELKTPCTELVDKKNPYRTGAYSPSQDLSGSVSQTLTYKNVFMQNFIPYKPEDAAYEAFDPRILLIIGKCESLDKNMKRSFDMYRYNLKNIEIITYDELFSKISSLIDLFKQK